LEFLRRSIKEKNCSLQDPLVVCVPMEGAPVEAAFHVKKRQVVMNSLTVHNQQDATRLLIHELTHAFDMCRVYMDPSDCRHAACTEVRSAGRCVAARSTCNAQIRASNLSTECSWKHEWFGTNRTPSFGLQGQQQACVKRRAAMSISMLEACREKSPDAVVESVFERCYADTAPFPRTPI
jgi:mitochondrial inner membrane protease ATP23